MFYYSQVQGVDLCHDPILVGVSHLCPTCSLVSDVNFQHSGRSCSVSFFIVNMSSFSADKCLQKTQTIKLSLNVYDQQVIFAEPFFTMMVVTW